MVIICMATLDEPCNPKWQMTLKLAGTATNEIQDMPG